MIRAFSDWFEICTDPIPDGRLLRQHHCTIMQNAGAAQQHGSTDLSKSRDLSGERMEVHRDTQVLHQTYLQHVTTASPSPINSSTDKAGDTPAPKTMTAELLPIHKKLVKPATLRRKQQPQQRYRQLAYTVSALA